MGWQSGDDAWRVWMQCQGHRWHLSPWQLSFFVEKKPKQTDLRCGWAMRQDMYECDGKEMGVKKKPGMWLGNEAWHIWMQWQRDRWEKQTWDTVGQWGMTCMNVMPRRQVRKQPWEGGQEIGHDMYECDVMETGDTCRLSITCKHIMPHRLTAIPRQFFSTEKQGNFPLSR